MSTEFLVTWSMPIEADDMVDAAQQALGIHRDPGSVATAFRVDNLEDGSTALIDLDPDGSLSRILP